MFLNCPAHFQINMPWPHIIVLTIVFFFLLDNYVVLRFDLFTLPIFPFICTWATHCMCIFLRGGGVVV